LNAGAVDDAIQSLENVLRLDKGNERAKRLLQQARSKKSE
jgi:hypothetical protein